MLLVVLMGMLSVSQKGILVHKYHRHLDRHCPRFAPRVDECGCRLGSLVASITLTGYLVLAIALPLLCGTSITFSWWQALAALIGGALVGKTVGVLRARRLHERKAL